MAVVTGTVNNDTLYGSSGDDTLFGLGGIDRLFGGDGVDSLDGGSGADVMAGGIGANSYVVDNIGDYIFDFNSINATAAARSKIYVNVDNYKVREWNLANTDVIYGSGVKKLDYFIDSVYSGARWASHSTMGSGTNIRYTFNGSGYNDVQKAAIRSIFSKIAFHSGLTFTETEAAQQDGNYNYINFQTATFAGADAQNFATTYGDTQQIAYSTIQVNTSSAFYDQILNPVSGNYGYMTFLHEILHAIGFKHPFEDSAQLPTAEDNVSNTVMSYTGNNVQPLPSTMQIFDLAALHYAYGVNAAYNSTNTIYTLDDHYVADGSGTDYFYVGSQSQGGVETRNATINLTPGSWNYVGSKNSSILAEGQSFIGFGTTIENLDGGAGNDTLTGNTVNNIINGGAGNDVINGGAGNDALNGGIGVDTLSGGVGSDTYYVDNSGDVITENLNEGTDTINSSVSITALTANVENLVLTGSAAINGTGNALNNTITGNDGNNSLNGGSGNDSIIGGLGNDYLNGSTGTDTLTGGLGDDIYVVYSGQGADVMVEGANAGTDSVRTNMTVSIANLANIENIYTFGGTENISLTGNALNNTITGNDGNNALNGGAGSDILKGGLGNDIMDGGTEGDWVDYRDITGAVSVDLSITTQQNTGAGGLDTITNVEYIMAGGGNDTLIGNASTNYIRGGLGNDSMNGGAGLDYIDFREVTTAVSVNLSLTTAQNTGQGSDTIINFENALTGSGNDILTGSSLNNILSGYAGNDTIKGGLGNDTISGGTGNDTYLFARGDGQDVLNENDATAGNSDLLWFNSGVNSSQLWFQQSGNNLVVSVIGSTDKITIGNWYLGTAYQTEQIKAADGKVLLNTEVNALVNAMAAFTPPAAGQTTLPANYQSALNPVLAANWS